MWISKSKWNEIGNELDNLGSRCTHNEIINQTLRERLADAEIAIENLTKAHNEIEDEEEYLSFPNGMYGRYEMKKRTIKKYNHTINTSTIPSVTLEELAKLVIDGEPIVREQTIKVKKEYGRV